LQKVRILHKQKTNRPGTRRAACLACSFFVHYLLDTTYKKSYTSPKAQNERTGQGAHAAMNAEPAGPNENAIEIFYSYAHEDEALRKELEKHLALLQRQGYISGWNDRSISPGSNWEQEINTHLNTAQIILLLVSSDFLASDFCYSVEMKRALERHGTKEARVIPIILRPCDWKDALFSKLQVIPTDAKPITKWQNQDDAFLDVAEGIRKAVKELKLIRTTFSKPSQSIWNIPFERNPYFTGRADILTNLHNALNRDKTAALTQSPQAISGLGGIGKTQTAIEYAYRHRDNYSYVFWVKSDTREQLISDFIAIANLLNLSEKDAQDQGIIVDAVKKWLAANTSWLLILDNADDLAMAKDFIPSLSKGHILLTTRAQIMGRLAKRVEIEKMELEEGTLFLLRRANIIAPDASLDTASPTDAAKAKEIVQAVDGLPLALDQAAAYIEETECGLAGYLNRYQTQGAILLQHRGDLISDHPDPVATTWKLSFQKVEQANLAAADLLRLCAFLSPDAIPEEIITEGAVDLGPILQPIASDPVELDAAIEELRKYSLVRRDPDAQTLTVHRLVQAVLKDEMDEETQGQWAERVVRAVNRAFPYIEYERWLKCARLLPHARVCAELIEQWMITFPEAAELLDQTGWYLRERIQYAEAEPLHQRALAINEQVLGLEDSAVAYTFSNLGMLYQEQGKYAKAEPLYQRAQTIYEKVLGPDHPYVASSLNNLALLYQDRGKYGQAEPLLQRAVAIDEKVYSSEHPDAATHLENYANLLRETNREDEAAKLEERARAIRAKHEQENPTESE